MVSLQSGMQEETVPKRFVAPKVAAITMFVFWLGILAFHVYQQHISLLSGVAFVWFIYNFVCWLVPEWRRAILSHRASSVGEGFAFGAAVVSTVSIFSHQTFTSWPVLLVVLFCFMYAPFLLMRIGNVPACKPHWLDLVVSAYLLFIAIPWSFLSLPTLGAVPLNTFASAALCVTFFLAIRFWNRTDWSLRWPQPVNRQVAWSAAFIIGVGILSAVLFETPIAIDTSTVVTWGLLLGPFSAMVVYGVIYMVLYEHLTEMKTPNALFVTRIVSVLIYVMFSFAFAPNQIVLMTVVGIMVALTVQRRELLAPAMALSTLGYTVASLFG